jgi:hypothetical protein
MRQYQAHNETTTPGVRTALLIGLGAAVGMGFVLYALEHYVHLYFVGIFPVLAGAAVGLALARGIYIGKLRNLSVATALGIVCGLSLMLAYHSFSYQIGYKEELRQASPGIPEADLQNMSDELLFVQTGQTGFLGYMGLQAKQGMTITRSVGSGTAISLNGPWVYLFYALEALIATWMVLAFARRQTLEPFDTYTQRWYGVARRLFSVPVASQKALLDALGSAQLETANGLSGPTTLPAPRLEVMVRTADGGDPNDIVLEVKRLHVSNRPNSATLIKRYLISAAELERLMGPSSPQVVTA